MVLGIINLPMFTSTSFAISGTGSSYDPYCVENFEDFKYLMESPRKLHVKLPGKIMETLPANEKYERAIKVNGEKIKNKKLNNKIFYTNLN